MNRSRRLRLGWAHLLLGGALLMPYFLLVTVGIGLVRPDARPFSQLGWQLAAYAMSLPLVALTAALFPLVRPLEIAAARALCAVPAGSLGDTGVSAGAGAGAGAGAAGTGPVRWRTSAWFVLHVGLGALLSGMTLAIPPAVFVLLALPFSPTLRETEWSWPWDWDGVPLWTAPVTGLLLLAALLAAVHAAGLLLSRCAPVLLGPTPADRLADAERRAAELAARNRLARELHDSVGHALSAVTLQAAAAGRVLAADPEFVRQALTAIEETTREAVAELDAVLYLLREADEPPAGDPSAEGTGSPTLAAALGGLLRRTGAAGVRVDCDAAGSAALEALPPLVSREAYRIVQEGLTNALRHAEGQPVRLCLALTAGEQELEITVENPLPRAPQAAGRAAEPGAGPDDPALQTGSGGRGLRGIAERAVLLGGSAEAGPADGPGTDPESGPESGHETDPESARTAGVWRLTARLPLRENPPAAARPARGGRA